jgi:hypothetical protein
MLTGFVRDVKSWNALLDWAREQNFDDYTDKPESVPFRVKIILERYAKLDHWDGTRMDFAQGFLQGHYAAKPTKK